MKALAINIIFFLLIAIVGLILLISLVTGTFQSAVKWLYCDVYIKIITSFMGQETASIPKDCLTEPPIPTIEIQESDNKLFSRKLLSIVIACWKEAEVEQQYKTHACYELQLKKVVDNVTEENVSSILINEDRCKSIENSDYGCGARDQILWDIYGSVINNQKIILVKYYHDNTTEAVRVIG